MSVPANILTADQWRAWFRSQPYVPPEIDAPPAWHGPAPTPASEPETRLKEHRERIRAAGIPLEHTADEEAAYLARVRNWIV